MTALFSKLAVFVGGVSPKVKVGMNWGVIASLALAFLNSITPEMLAPLGKWEPLVWALVPIVIAGAAAWVKTDDLREAGKDALAKAAAEAQAAAEAAVKPGPVVDALPPVVTPAEPAAPAPAAPAAPSA